MPAAGRCWHTTGADPANDSGSVIRLQLQFVSPQMEISRMTHAFMSVPLLPALRDPSGTLHGALCSPPCNFESEQRFAKKVPENSHSLYKNMHRHRDNTTHGDNKIFIRLVLFRTDRTVLLSATAAMWSSLPLFWEDSFVLSASKPAYTRQNKRSNHKKKKKKRNGVSVK